eukprot:1143186-Pelagomonas_calceolata.AAC.2
MAFVALPVDVDGTYESLEERRRKAAEAVRHLKALVISHQTSAHNRQCSLRDQQAQVATLKKQLSAHAYLAVSTTGQNTDVYLQGAKNYSTSLEYA